METPRDRSPGSDAVRNAVAAQRDRYLAMIRRRGGGVTDAEDILQAAFERALSKSDQLRDVSRAEAWVGRVVRNVLIDERRKQSLVVSQLDELERAPMTEGSVDCGCVLVQAEQLKPEYATILRRVIVDGVSVTEVAAELGLTANNATVRLHRARHALRIRLEAHCGTTSTLACSDCGCEERGCCPAP